MLSYVVCAATYLFLLVASLTVWRQRLRGSSLAAAFGAQLAWSVVLAIESGGADIPLAAVAAIECLRSLAWVLILARWLTAGAAAQSIHRLLSAVAVTGWVCCLGLLLLPLGSERATSFRLWTGLTLSTVGLIVVEQVARNTRTAHQWHLKYLWLAVAALFTWDLFVYSSALLEGGMQANLWVARGFVNALIGALLVIGLRRMPVWQIGAFLSPRPVFFNATLLGAMFYILGTAAASHFIGSHGGSVGEVGQAVFLAGAALVLVVVLVSERFRAWTRVMLAKHFFPYRYDYRNEWQKLTRALSRSDETPVYERIATLIAGSVNCGSGGLWLRDSEDVFVPVGGDLAEAGAPVESGNPEFFEYLRVKEWIFDLDAARAANPRDKIPRPPGWMLANANLWLVVPLLCEETLVGFVALSQPLARMRLTWEEIDLLRAAGRQVASFLALEQAARRLAEARQFEALNRVSAVLMHDLRHLIAQQALVVQNAAKHRGNPAFFDDAILTIDNSVKRMNRLMDELRSGMAMDQTQRINLGELCGEAVERCGSRVPAPILIPHDRSIEIVANRDRMLHVVEHVIRNAQDATPSSGAVCVELRRCGQRAVIEVKDTGTGMDTEFIRHRLFRPFDTTKGERGMGIGAYEVRKSVMQCGGKVEVDSSPGRGTKFTISLPLSAARATRDHTLRDELHTS
jgi:putative PEP-CTERM system histidine kinase